MLLGSGKVKKSVEGPFEYVGLGVAMKNAPDELKKHAQYVAPSNDENGVADVIERLML